MTFRSYTSVLAFPVILLLVGCIPKVSWFVWSGHGGFGWLLLPLCFPYICIRLVILIWRAQPQERVQKLRFAAFSVFLYLVIAIPATNYTERYINSTIGAFIQRGTLVRLAIFPVGLAIPNHNPKP